MNAYNYTYLGQPVQVLGPSKDAYLIQIGDRLVRVEKQVKIRKWPKLSVIQGGLTNK